MEDRTLLSVFTVDRLTDANPTGGGEGSGLAGDLRYAINQANSLSGNDSITFDVTGAISLARGLPSLSSDLDLQGPGANLLTVRGNLARNDGIFTVGSGTNVTISGLTITSGHAQDGGAIFNTGVLTLNHSTVSGNQADDSGGGIFNVLGATLTLNHSTLSGNRAESEGGAIYNRNGSVTLNSSTVSGNEAMLEGGGIFNNTGATLRLNHSTVRGNDAIQGGGLAIFGPFTARNTIIAGNTAIVGPDLDGHLGSLGHNLIGNSNGGTGYAPTDLLNVDPRLGPLQDNGGPTSTHALLTGSPARDAGDNTDAPATDQRGFPRIVGGTIDIGAFEVQPPPQLQFSAASYSVAENDGSAPITVTRLGELAGTVTVNYATSNGTALAGQDYTAASGTLTFTQGQTSATVAIPILDDTFVEGGETVILTLSNPTGGALLGSPSGAVLTITDDEITTLRVASFASTSTGFVANFTRPFDPAGLNLYDTQTGGLGAADVTLVGATTGAVRGSLVRNAGNTGFAFIKTGSVLAADTYTVTLRSAGNGFKDMMGGLLDGNADGTPGDNYTALFTVAASSANIASIPDFARGPNQAVNIPTTSNGIPLRLSTATGVDSVDLTLRYDPALLTITGAVRGPLTPTDAQVTLNTTTPGVAILSFSSATPLSSTANDFVLLTATVPLSAINRYTGKHVLDLSNVLVNDIAARDDDGIHINAYFGDTNANGSYSSLDAQRTARVVVGLDGGFQFFPLGDPVVVADITGNSLLTSTDATRILQKVVGLEPGASLIPMIPAGITIPQPPGPDPLLRFSKRLRGRPGQTITAPLLLDPADGLQSADLAIAYDAQRLEVVEVRRGSLTRDFDLFLHHLDAATGTLRVGMAQTAGANVSGRGSVLEIVFRIRSDAPAGRAIVNLRRDLGALMTQLNEGGLDLIPDPSNEAGDALDGAITVVAPRKAGNASRTMPVVDAVFAELARQNARRRFS